MMRHLPPLRALEAFIRTARLGSAKAAAEELGLSAPALSRRLKTLEEHIGRPLFDRSGQGMIVNAEGEQLLEAVAAPIEALTLAVDSLSDRGGEQRLRLGVLPLFGSQRLIPKLPDLRRAFPRLHIDVDTQHHAVKHLGETVDAAIVIDTAIDPKLYSVRLDSNRIHAIAARELAQDIADPRDLSRYTVLVHSDMPELYDLWRRSLGVPELRPAAVDQMDSGSLMLEAAAQGLGVAIMHGSHLSDARDTRLTRLFDHEVESPYSYWFVCRPRALEQRPVRLFHDWLLKAAV